MEVACESSVQLSGWVWTSAHHRGGEETRTRRHPLLIQGIYRTVELRSTGGFQAWRNCVEISWDACLVFPQREREPPYSTAQSPSARLCSRYVPSTHRSPCQPVPLPPQQIPKPATGCLSHPSAEHCNRTRIISNSWEEAGSKSTVRQVSEPDSLPRRLPHQKRVLSSFRFPYMTSMMLIERLLVLAACVAANGLPKVSKTHTNLPRGSLHRTAEPSIPRPCRDSRR